MSKLNKDTSSQPLIPPEKNLPEFTFKVIALAIVLAVLLGASNAYLALKVGNTVAASIPAAVISLAIFRLFRNSNVLENNLVQTAASAGEGLAAAITFILPALIIIKFWPNFKFWQTVIITMTGGILGVLFSVPLRKTLLDLKGLPFPEGTAIGNVLKASTTAGSKIKTLIMGGAAGAAVAFSQTGLEVVSTYMPLWGRFNNVLFGTTLGFDSVLIGAGYIIGITATLAMFSGLIIVWLFGMPVLSHIYGIPAANNYDSVMTLWSQHIRFIGVGTMLVAGLWTLITLSKFVGNALLAAKKYLRSTKTVKTKVVRTEKDMPLSVVFWVGLICLVISFFILLYAVNTGGLALPFSTAIIISLIGALAILVLGLLSVLICGYIVGLIGSSNAPLSGIVIINVLILSLIIFPIIRWHADLSVHFNQQAAVAIVIITATMISVIGAITLENIQDLKAGRMVGATPWKQQTMMVIGVVVSAIAITPVLQLLFNAYGIGGVYPHSGMNPAQMLPAPQAGLMAALASGVIGHNLPWNMLITGMIIALVGIVIDETAKRYGYRLPVLAVGLGIYLPPEIILPTVFGGFTHYLVTRALAARTQKMSTAKREAIYAENGENSTLLACGLVAGSSLVGVILAIPFVIKGNSDALKIVSDSFTPIANILGLIITVALCIWLFRSGTRIKK